MVPLLRVPQERLKNLLLRTRDNDVSYWKKESANPSIFHGGRAKSVMESFARPLLPNVDS